MKAFWYALTHMGLDQDGIFYYSQPYGKPPKQDIIWIWRWNR